ncbi:PAS domain-containing sensor histidine kinase [Magnetovibrio sp.]|uniref:PAS domain-containing sensor histidine kinase n=1 Tax=Magnetovibrio sp. TaxID=2024836 RepID=UPI002F94126F
MASSHDPKSTRAEDRLGSALGDFGELGLTGLQETAWVEVIAKMEEVYSDLIQYDIDLERKNTELEETHQFIDSVISSMSEILIVCDRDQYVEQINRATEDLTGFTAQDLVGKKLVDLVVDPGSCRFENIGASRSPNGTAYCEVRLKSRLDEMGTDPVSMNASVRIDHQGRPVGIVIIGRPMGELRRAYQALNKAHADLVRAQQRLVQSEKLASLGRLVAGVAHELNNPISFINGNIHSLDKYKARLKTYFEAVNEGGGDWAQQQKLRRELKIDRILEDLDPLVEGTLEGADRVRDIVKNLRRLSFNGAELTEPFDLVKIVQTGVSWVKRSAPQPVEVKLDVPQSLEVVGHAGRIHQVVVNLVDNALDAVADVAEPNVKILVRQENGYAVMSVSDNGCGISANDLPNVFDPFFTTKGVGEGTGLGLWISYDLVHDHDGTLSIESEPGRGTTLTMSLPVAT